MTELQTQSSSTTRGPGPPSSGPRPSTAPDGPAAPARVARHAVPALARRHGVLIALAVTIVVFSLLRPDTFPTLDNAQAMLRELAPLAIAAFGLTVVLVMNDFDLSLGAMIGLGGTIAVVLMAKSGISVPLAILLTLGVGMLVGILNGLAIAFAGASSFVITLAMGTILQGVEYQVSNQQSVFQNVPAAYGSIANGSLLGISTQVYIAAGVFVVLLVLLERSEIGRYMYAIGGNIEAARLSGMRVRWLRLLGFMITAVCSATAGILLTSQAGQSTPDLGLPYLLPVFAAVFLGSTAIRVGKFNIVGTLVGALFLQVISTGLILLELKPAFINIVQGAILAASVLLARLGRNDARR